MTRKLVTNEEAIKCLTIELGLRAEGYHSYLSHYGKQDKAEEEFLDSLQTAISALREQCVRDATKTSKVVEIDQFNWISVAERLPEKYTIVLCYKDGQRRLGYYIGAEYGKGVAAFRHPKDQFAFGVTHWMPMPEPPEVEV